MHCEEYSILVVDDDATSRAILAGCLEREFYNVAEAQDGAEAVALMGIEHFDLMLLDINMPDVDGFQVLASVRKDPKNKRMHVMMTTGSKEAANVTKSARLGAEEYIVKPYDLNNIRTRVWRCLTRDAAQKPPSAPIARIATARVGVLDPDTRAQQALRRTLSADGNKVTILTGESDVLAGIECGELDLIVIDAASGEFDGLELIGKIKSQDFPVPVIVVTADERQETLQRCIARGAAEYLVKPFHAGKLRARVQACMANRKTRKAQGA